MKQRPTRADVALQAGVSKTTVTYVLSERYDIAIPARTRARVQAVAQELGYQPHAAARALASGRTNSITVAFPERIGAHYAHLLQAFERRTNAHGYHMIASTLGHVNIENVLPDLCSLLGNLTDGVILVDMPANFRPYINEMLPNTKAIVSMGVFTVPNIDSVEVALGSGVDAALAHLLEYDPKRIAYFGPSSADDHSHLDNIVFEGDPRPVAYRRAVEQAGKSPEIIEGFPADRRASMESLRRYIRKCGCPDALFCFNDEIAISACRALRELGIRVPEDTRVVGCDGSEEGEYAYPSLSTIAQPLDRLCDLAWQFMATRLSEPNTPRQYATVDGESFFGIHRNQRLSHDR